MVEALHVENAPVDMLRVDDKNVKTHSPDQIEQIKASILKFGFNDPLGVERCTGIIVEGAGRFEAAKLLGITEVPVIFMDFPSVAERRAYAVAHNQTQQLSRLDEGLVIEEFERIGVAPEDLNAIGFTLDDVAFMSLERDQKTTNGEAQENRVDTPGFAIQRSITSKINFDSQTQLMEWLAAMDWLRTRYPEANRISERLTALMGQYEGSLHG